jgi:hypothetical protein
MHTVQVQEDLTQCIFTMTTSRGFRILEHIKFAAIMVCGIA